MKKLVGNAVKSAFSACGLFVGRQFPNVVTGYDLQRDLTVILRKSNPVCFDVGANQGQTIRLLQHCYKNPVIHSFEPSAATYKSLASSNLHSDVQVHQLALGERAEVAEFHNYGHSELSSLLTLNADTTENVFAREAMVSIESVRVDTLDQFCITHAVDHIDLLKIDTQGYELPVLRGGKSLFRQERIGAVLLELNFSSLYEGQSDPLEIMQLLRTHNMRLVDFYENERVGGNEISWTTALFVHRP